MVMALYVWVAVVVVNMVVMDLRVLAVVVVLRVMTVSSSMTVAFVSVWVVVAGVGFGDLSVCGYAGGCFGLVLGGRDIGGHEG